MTSVLAIATHPDDETLGCSGTLLKHYARGDHIYWLIVTRTWEPLFSPGQVAQQKRQVRAVEQAYPFDRTFWLDFPTTQLETIPLNDLIRKIHEVIVELRPDCVYVPNRSDVHSDHRVTFHAVMAVLKSFHMNARGVRRILACEVLSETDAAPQMLECSFAPTVYSDITATMERKLELMSLFESEVQPDPGPRSLSAIKSLARYRGASINVQYAEAFSLVRESI